MGNQASESCQWELVVGLVFGELVLGVIGGAERDGIGVEELRLVLHELRLVLAELGLSTWGCALQTSSTQLPTT